MKLRPAGRSIDTATGKGGIRETADGFEISAYMGRQDLEELNLQVRWLAQRYGFKVTEFRLEPAGDGDDQPEASESAAGMRSPGRRQQET